MIGMASPKFLDVSRDEFCSVMSFALHKTPTRTCLLKTFNKLGGNPLFEQLFALPLRPDNDYDGVYWWRFEVISNSER